MTGRCIAGEIPGRGGGEGRTGGVVAAGEVHARTALEVGEIIGGVCFNEGHGVQSKGVDILRGRKKERGFEGLDL